MTTYETVQDQFVQVGDIRFAYRHIGLSEGVPLVLLMHFRGTMDHWDPVLINTLAAARPVILIDNAGVGRSGGQVPETLQGWAQHYLDVMVKGLGISHFDVAGFSMGGMVAQILTLNAALAGADVIVRSLVLLGTMPSVGEGVTHADRAAYNQLRAAASHEEQRAAFLANLFEKSPTSQAAGKAAWDRITSARKERLDHVGAEGTKRQGAALVNFLDPTKATDGSFNRLDELQMPVLIATGSLLYPTRNVRLHVLTEAYA
ncbi:hypothetical protein NLG97_g3190 [Lecanicillium saksenae]|uniref:Uncharacterized protein n=1 Tax=Lecanicillium saksenae TaxID=468837 RepID=A0ACC1R0K2_9HYPO|nr:hypothetical protein NLG97_g3190 [Lecanicillium saksenae]